MADDFSFANLHPRCWLDAFPWLQGAAAPGSTPWWNDSIAGPDTVTRHQRLATISELAMERLARWTIGEIFPGLPSDLGLRDLNLPTRATDALIGHGYLTSDDLIGASLDAIMNWPRVGIGTIAAILYALADVSTTIATPAVTGGRPPTRARPQALVSSIREAWAPSVIDDLTQIARWYATLGVPDESLLEQRLPRGAPAEIVKARQRLKDLRASDILSEGKLGTDVAALFDNAFGLLDPRAVQILNARLLADQPVTLDKLGRQHNVTRERIRQIEGNARGALLSIISENGPLAALADAARAQIGSIRPLDELLKLIPALAKRVKSVDQPAWRLLDRLDDAYEIEDGWCVVPTMTAAQTMTQTQLGEQADQYGVVRLEDLRLIETSTERHCELTASWLAHCGYIVDGDFVLTQTQSVGDYAAAILSLTGTPLSAQSIVDRFIFNRSANSLRNTMAADDRFERVDRDSWALSEWGMEAYSGIRSLIREQVARNGGRVKIDDLVEYITGRYSVNASSVVTYASSPPFHQRDGIVRLAATSPEAKKTPQRTRRLFRRHDAWAYRIRVTKDHLRGSGSAAPMAIVKLLKLQFGETRQLESPLGPQTVAWTGQQPSFGTIRRFLMDRDVAAGSDVFLVIHDNGRFSFEPAREATGNPLKDALSLIGAPATTDRETARTAIAMAVGLSDATPVTSVIGAYRERGDGDIADLLTMVREYLETGHTQEDPSHSADINEILDLL